MILRELWVYLGGQILFHLMCKQMTKLGTFWKSQKNKHLRYEYSVPRIHPIAVFDFLLWEIRKTEGR